MLEQIISQRLQIPLPQVEGTVRLLREGATIPFISRYRKEVTGSLDEVAVGSVRDLLERPANGRSSPRSKSRDG